MKTGNLEKFLEHLKTECEQHGIKLILKQKKYLVINKRFRCRGYFDDYNRELVCSTDGGDNYLEVLVHEYAHMTQWLDNSCKQWINERHNDSGTKLEAWLIGEDIEGIEKHIYNVRDLELDNEKRTVQIMKNFHLDIDIDAYIKKANSYVLSHNRMIDTRKWISTNVIYHPSILQQMPTHFDIDYSYENQSMRQLFAYYEKRNK